MPKILVALDGSSGSEKALEAAVGVAQKNDGDLAAIAVVERAGDPHLAALSQNVQSQRKQHLQEVMQAAVNFARSRGVQLAAIVREGHPAEAIVACAEEQGTEVLILGSSKGDTSRPGLGGTADQVSSHSPCTVMIVK